MAEEAMEMPGDETERYGAENHPSASQNEEWTRIIDHRSTPESEGRMVGASIGRFKVLGILGRGGMGAVYEAFDCSLDRRIAVKVLHHDVSAEYEARLVREAQALAQLSHPNVVQVYEVGIVGGRTFVAIELVQGQTLREWVRQEPRPNWRACVEVYLQAGAGLAAAHRRGLVHRDFKPSNVILGNDGRVRVLDFGLALTVGDRSTNVHTASSGSWTGGDTRLTENGVVMGTPAYMPLEQMCGEDFDARGDQFSFCVALFEAVYGERPFVDASFDALMEDRQQGILVDAPQDTQAPAKLRELLAQGLAPTPEQRWPTMEVLLEQLRELVAPRRGGGVLVLSTAMVTGLALLGAGVAYQAEVKQRCTGAWAQLEGVWDEGRKSQVEEAILATGLSYAPGTWMRVEQRLDAYTEAWANKHTEICEATTARREQSEEDMGLRMSCLHDRKVALNAAVNVLADADARVVKKAVNAVADLPRLSRCDDVEWLRDQRMRVPPPTDPAVAREVQALRERLAGIEANHQGGKYTTALELVEPVVERATVLDYAPLLAEAKLQRGQLRDVNAEYDEAEQDLEQAYSLATEHGHDEVALVAARRLAFAVGYHQERHAEGVVWGQASLPLAKRSGEDTELASSLDILGAVFFAQARYKDAEHHHRRALRMRQDALGTNHPAVASSVANLGSALFRQGRYEEAEHHYRRALQIRESAFGPSHLFVAMSENNLANAFAKQARYDEAEHHHGRALRIFEHALGADHPGVGMSVNNLAGILYKQGKYEEAEPLFRRALALVEQALGPDHVDVGTNAANLGLVLMDQKKYEEAERHLLRALRIDENAVGADHPHIAHPLLGLATIALEQHEFESARDYAERAASVRKAGKVAPDEFAEAHFVLARALWEDPDERPRAHELAEQARDAYLEHGAGKESALADVEQWLTEHPRR